MGRVSHFVLIILCLVAPVSAQTTVAMGDDPEASVVLPKGWIPANGVTMNAGFRGRGDASLLTVFYSEGNRPTDVPFALLERFMTSPQRDTIDETADRVAIYYQTAVASPSKADRIGTWKSAQVSTPVIDRRRGVFTFRATINFEGGINAKTTYYVTVVGHFGEFATMTLSTWSDDDARAAHTAALNALATGGIQLTGAAAKPDMSFQEKLVWTAKVAGVILILLVIGLQVFVIVRERRQRQADEAAFREPLV
jgi:hypothetical protein